MDERLNSNYNYVRTPKRLVQNICASPVTDNSIHAINVESISLHRMRRHLRGILRLIIITVNTLQRQQLTFG